MGGRVNDWISALCDELIDHILSYLPTKNAVQTSVLSKRWKKLWASVSVLTFKFSEFCLMEKENETLLLDECNDKFVKFVDYVLASRNAQQIDRFTLVWENQVKVYPGNAHPVRRWISLVLLQRPLVLSIYVQPSKANAQIVPDMAFTCSSLEEMKLQIQQECWPEVLEPNLVNLPSLKRLYLGYFTIKADFMSKLLLGCPKLEELELYACGLNFSQIYCGNLKSLVLDGCCAVEEIQEIRVSIPSLQYLKVTLMSSDTAGSFIFENMSTLVKACVCFCTVGYYVNQFDSGEAKILNDLSRVTNLDVVLHGSQAAGMLKHALNNYPYFENLKAVHFEIFDGYLSDCMDMIGRLVQHSPILEKFSFYCCKDLSDENKENLRKTVCELGNCQIIQQSNQGHIYQSVVEVNNLLDCCNVLHMEDPTDDGDGDGDGDGDDDGGDGGGGGGGIGGDDDEDAGGDGGGVGGEGDVEQ